MDIKNGLSKRSEYNISIEDVSVTLLIDEKKNEPIPDFFKEVSHVHSYNELFICVGEEITIQLDNDIIRLTKDDAALIPANISHHIIDGQPVDTWYSVGFSVIKKPKTASKLYSKLAPLITDNTPKVFTAVPEICKRIADLHSIRFEENDQFPSLEFMCVLSLLAKTKPKGEKTAVVSPSRMQDIYRMAYFDDIIQNRFYEPLTISKLASALNLSTRQLERIIKARFGMTFHEVLTEKRLSYATNRLVTSNHSITSILREIGYTKSSLFYRDFAKKYNMTPTEYRAKFSKTNLI